MIKKDNSWTTEQLKFVQPDSWQVIVNQAEKKGDEILLRRIRGYDLVACGAQYHNSCQKEYMVNPDNWRSMNEESTEDQKSLEQSHEKAFMEVCKIISDKVIGESLVMKVTELRDLYVNMLDETNHPNKDYRTEKLEKKILPLGK